MTRQGGRRSTYAAHLRCSTDDGALDEHGWPAIQKAIVFRAAHAGPLHHLFVIYPPCDFCSTTRPLQILGVRAGESRKATGSRR